MADPKQYFPECEDDFDFDDDGPIYTKVCRYCGRACLEWKWTERGYRLYDPNDNSIHECKNYTRRDGKHKSVP